MRMRIEKERTPSGQDELAIKTGRGGLMDAELCGPGHVPGKRLGGAEHVARTENVAEPPRLSRKRRS